MIFYKGIDAGITVREKNEAYTSKCDALSLESVKVHEVYMGKRIKRGQFKSATGIYLNADVNSGLNILRKDDNNDIKKELFTKIKIKCLGQPIRVKII